MVLVSAVALVMVFEVVVLFLVILVGRIAGCGLQL
jgi:hypothetical protein